MYPSYQYQYPAPQHDPSDFVLVFDHQTVVRDVIYAGKNNPHTVNKAYYVGKPLALLPLPAPAIDAINKATAELNDAGGIKAFVYTTLTEGRETIFKATLTPRYDTAGAAIGCTMCVRDVTETTLGEYRYKDILNKYNLAVKAANFGIYEFNYDTGEFYWDEVMQSMFGCVINSVEDFQNTWLALLHSSSYPGLMATYKSALKNGTDLHAEFSITVNGETRHIETFATFQYNKQRRWSEKITGIALDRTQKKNERLALQKSENLYRMLADNMPGLIVLVSPTLQRLYVSPSCKSVTGYDAEDFLHGTVADIIHPDDKAGFMDSFNNNVLNQPGKATITYRIQHRHGSWLHVKSQLNAIRDTDGRLVNIISVTTDVSAEYKAQEALRKNKQRYKMVTDHIADMLILYSADLQRLYVSPSSINSIGYTPEEMMHQPLFNIIHPDDVSLLRDALLDNVKKQNNKFTVEFRARHKNGTWLNCLCSFVTIHTNGGAPNYLGTFRDVTAERCAQQNLQQSEHRYRSLVEVSDDIILIMAKNGRYLFANKIACQKINQPVENVIGKTIYDFFDQATGDVYVSYVNQILQWQQKYFFENTLVINGAKLWLRNTGLPLPSGTYDEPAVMFCIADITSLKNYARTLEVQNEELKKIAYLQSHLVRAPLANIEGLVNLLGEVNSPEETAQYIQLIKQATSRLDTIIREVVTRAIDGKKVPEG